MMHHQKSNHGLSIIQQILEGKTDIKIESAQQQYMISDPSFFTATWTMVFGRKHGCAQKIDRKF